MFRPIETLILLILFNGVVVNCKFETYVTWEDGRFSYFAVPRERVASKLAEVQQQSSCHEEHLTLPNRPVLQNLLQPDEHVVAIVYGKLGAVSIEDSLSLDVGAKYETKAGNVQFFIPFLTGLDPNAEPTYKLALGSYVSTAKPFIQPNVAIPTEQVESLDARHDGLVVVDGTDVLEIHWPTFHDCVMPEESVVNAFEEYVNEFTLSFGNNPDYSFCDEPDAGETIFCKHRNIAECACLSWTLEQNNVCEVWTHEKTDAKNKRCKAEFFSVVTITEKFKEVSLLYDGPQNATLTEITNGCFRIDAQKSCIE